MSSPRFLLDEKVPPALAAMLRQQEPRIDVRCVGEPGAPARATKDPDLLLATEAMGRILITLDRKSMPGHLANHSAAARHTAGVLLLRNGFSLAQYAAEILLIWGASEADEWVDRPAYIP